MNDELTHEGAFLKALQNILNGDEVLRTRGNGAFYGRAEGETLTPFLTYRIIGVMRTRTFDDEAFRLISFFVKATWDDRAGTNYAHGDRLIARVNFLLDGGAKDQNGVRRMNAVQALLNSQLSLDGFYAMGCALETPLPVADEFLGDSLTGRFNMGTLFHAHLRKSGT